MFNKNFLRIVTGIVSISLLSVSLFTIKINLTESGHIEIFFRKDVNYPKVDTIFLKTNETLYINQNPRKIIITKDENEIEKNEIDKNHHYYVPDTSKLNYNYKDINTRKEEYLKNKIK